MSSSIAAAGQAARPERRGQRWAVRIVAGLALGAALVAGAAEGFAWNRHQTVAASVSRLRASWAADLAAGLPPPTLAPLRAELGRTLRRSGLWWWPLTWGESANADVNRLGADTAAAFGTALSAARSRAAQTLAAWRRLIRTDGNWVPRRLVAEAATWPAALRAARTPVGVAALAPGWAAAESAARSAAARARLEALARATGSTGPGRLISTAAGLITIARADNLDPGAVPRLAGELRHELVQGQPGTATAARLTRAIAALRALIALNDAVAADLVTLTGQVDQAAAEQVPGAGALLAAYRADQASFTSATTQPVMRTIADRIHALGGRALTALAAHRCGHALPAGKVITIALSFQEMVFYNNGCAVEATPVTTGRPLLRTPTGTFHIFDKQTPYVFISPWPPGSPFWYPTSPVDWVMEFDQGGYYIHDAPWEPPGAFGLNSDNGVWASHGCVHTPTSVMRWAFGWTPLGTPVIVSA